MIIWTIKDIIGISLLGIAIVFGIGCWIYYTIKGCFTKHKNK